MNKREKEIENKSNRFVYDSDLGLSVIKQDNNESKEEIKKSEDRTF